MTHCIIHSLQLSYISLKFYSVDTNVTNRPVMLQEEEIQTLLTSTTGLDYKWARNFVALHDYFLANAGDYPSRGYIETRVGLLNVGDWVHRQRSKRTNNSDERIEMLNSIGFDW
jgi:hypothetical protein